jgi:hypothetical protein
VSAFGGKVRGGASESETKSEAQGSSATGRACGVCTYRNEGASAGCGMCGNDLPPLTPGGGTGGGDDGRRAVRAALTEASALAIRNRRANAMAGRGGKITEVRAPSFIPPPFPLLRVF